MVAVGDDDFDLQGECVRHWLAIASSAARAVRIVKRNKSAAVVLSEEEYLRLTGGQPPARPRVTAVQWLLSQSATGTRSKAEIDAALAGERSW